MLGRKPRTLAIRPADLPELERIARSDSSPWYQVRRARIVLGIGNGQPREHLAYRLDCAESTIWRTCQLYRACGLLACSLMADSDTPGVTWGSPQCKEHRSSNSPA